MNENKAEEMILEHVSLTQKGPEETQVLFDDLNLRIGGGELIALCGPSGSGKSTLLQLMAGFRKPDAGRVFWGETDLALLAGQKRRQFWNRVTGFAYQDYRLIPAFSAVENVMVPLLCGGMPKGQAYAAAMDMLQKVNLQEKAAQKPPSLSGGEQQRTAFARALVCRPALVLADEPSANLDRDNASVVWSLLEEMHRDGSTVIVSTHDPAACKRAAVIYLKTESGHSVPEWI